MSTLVTPVLESVDELIYWFGNVFRTNAHSFYEPEVNDIATEYTLATRKGSLVSVVKVHGAKKLVGVEEFEQIHKSVYGGLESFFADPGHHLQMYFLKDSEGVDRDIAYAIKPAEQTAERIGLDLGDIFAAKKSYMAKFCHHEECYLVCWTHPASMTKHENSMASKGKTSFGKENQVPLMRNCQDAFAAIPALRDRHSAYVKAVQQELKNSGVLAEVLNAHEAVRSSRMSFDPDYTDEEWKPLLYGDKICPRVYNQKNQRDYSDILPAKLDQQVMPRDAEEDPKQAKWVRVGDRIYSPSHLYLFQKELTAFPKLFNRLAETKAPWRCSIIMEGGGLKGFAMKSMVAAIIAWASPDNKLVNQAVNALNDYANFGGGTIVKVRMTFATWAKTGEEKLLMTREAQLARAVEGWGGCEIRDNAGDALEAFVSTTVGFTTKSVGVPAAAPLEDILYMMPFQRPASMWKNGAVLFRSPDGKLWPYQPGSSLQTTWIEFFFAKPGSGKSVLSNMLNFAIAVAPGANRLPRISIIDIGPSSSGLISLLQEALPSNQKHLAAYYRLRMTRQYAINPFDTQLGYQSPTPQERAFLVNFLTLLATPIGKDDPYDGISDMAGMICDEIFKEYDEEHNPKRYVPNCDRDVDRALEECGIHVDEYTTWWGVVKALYKANMIHEAVLAQRFAVPLVADIPSIINKQSFKDIYGKTKAPTGETLIEAYSRMIQSVLREYPILASETKFDIGDARVISLDLDEVAKSGGAAADRRTAIMYMLGRFVVAKNFYFNDKNLEESPELYRSYHKMRVDEIKEDAKRIVFDEFHRTSSAKAVREQVLVDMREGRKWGVQVALLSQSLSDFDDIMIDFATSIFILDGGNAAQVDEIVRKFGLSESARYALENRVHGPRAGGSTFLAIFSTKEGMNVQLLTSTIGPIELWAYSTTRKDTILRDKLYSTLGPARARKVLSERFPGGSAMDEIERREMLQKDEGIVDEDEGGGAIIEGIYREIMADVSKAREGALA